MSQNKNNTMNPPSNVGRSLWADARRRLWRDKATKICVGIIAFYTLIALGSAAYEFAASRSDSDGILTFTEMSDYSKTNQPPGLPSWNEFRMASGSERAGMLANILGTDWGGKSVLLKTILGAKVSMTVGFMANAIAVPLGIILGIIAGYYGKKLDTLIVWFFTVLMSVPGLILLITLKYAFKDVTVLGLDLGGIHGLYIALGAMSWIGTCRLVRAETMKLRELDYITAARSIGTSGPVILLCHILPNVMHLGIISFSLGFIGAIKAEVILSYLGLGVEVGTPSWGSMINSARLDLFVGRWWELAAAVTAMFFLVLAWNIFGDRLRDALDPKLRNV